MESWHNKPLYKLKEGFYANKLIREDDRPLFEKWNEGYNYYFDEVYEVYIQPLYEKYIKDKFCKDVWEKDKETGKTKRRNLYRHQQGICDVIFVGLFFRLKQLSHKTEKPAWWHETEPKEDYEKQVYCEFQRRLRERNVATVIEKVIDNKVKEMLQHQVNSYKEGIINYFLNVVEQRFTQLAEEIERVDSYVASFDVKQTILHTVMETAERDASTMFHQFKDELVKHMMP